MCKGKYSEMGLSSNQARFLSLTSRQIDLEQRIQQICQRRLRLSSELENVSTAYNNKISNRKMFTPSTAGINSLSMDGLKKLGYTVINAVTKTEAAKSMKPITQMSESAAIAAGYVTIHNVSELISNLNGGAATAGKTYVLQGDIDLSSLGTQSNAIITNPFQGTFDGNGYTISNMNINTNGTNTDNIGFFSSLTNTAIVKNVAIENSNIMASQSNCVGLLAGSNNGATINNCYSTGSVAGGTNSSTGVQSYNYTGGLVGLNLDSAIIKNSYSTASVQGNACVGGLSGSNGNSTIQNSFATGNVTANDRYIGGLSGTNWGASTISQSYATGDVSAYYNVGGLVGDFHSNGSNGSINDCYATGDVSGVDNCGGGLIGAALGSSGATATANNNYATGNVTGNTLINGFVGQFGTGANFTSNYYQNNRSDTNGGAIKGIPTTGWNANWDTSTTPPTLKNTVLQGSIPSEKLEDGLRNGVYSLAREADEFTQDPLTINGDKYQEVDWRSTPEIYDELYKGDDVDAENKYDKTISEINAQDKKLQLEQTSVEVEYKAISSERESVKKILDTNAQSSFKYFS